MGAILLVGIVVKNGILLLDRAQKAEEEGVPLHDAVMQAGRVRLRPILMTTMTAILGLVPLALGLGAGAEMQQPLAIAVIGGLSFSTLFTLFFAPLLYVALRRWQLSRAARQSPAASPDRAEVPAA
jgi:multidrug efflux pump subunit AcrB